VRAVIQRVKYASVTVDNETVGKINGGFLVLLGVGKGDTEAEADLLAAKIAKMRVFCDENGKMNLSLSQVGGEILVISQFTLYANCVHGNRPDFFNSEAPARANELYEYFTEKVKALSECKTEHGIFGADMKVELLNDGPVTIILDTDELRKDKK
jgi:D-tyrosyl-tRNA(Tyr) deacylase